MQEKQNEDKRAAGEAQLQQLRMQEGARIQGIQIGEGGRVQGLDAAGKQFMFNAQEQREMAQLDRVSAQLAGAEAQAMQASAARQANTAGLIGGLAGIGGNLLTGLAQQGASPYNNSASLNTGSGAVNFTNNQMSALINASNTASGIAAWLRL